MPHRRRVESWLSSHVFWDGDEPGSKRVQRTAQKQMQVVIEALWREGLLPYAKGKGWVVGYDAFLDFGGCSAFPILVGPGRPQRYRDRYAKVQAS